MEKSIKKATIDTQYALPQRIYPGIEVTFWRYVTSFTYRLKKYFGGFIGTKSHLC